MKPIFLLLFLMEATMLSAQQLTYHKDIAPLIQAKCAPCHHPGGGAPFSLLTYTDVSKRASFIKDIIFLRFFYTVYLHIISINEYSSPHFIKLRKFISHNKVRLLKALVIVRFFIKPNSYLIGLYQLPFPFLFIVCMKE